MIEVRIEREAGGALVRVSSTGHAGAGNSAACLAVTTLLKSAARALAERPALQITGAAPHPGSMRFRVEVPNAEDLEYARGVTELLVRGLSELAAEFPEELRLTLHESDEVESRG